MTATGQAANAVANAYRRLIRWQFLTCQFRYRFRAAEFWLGVVLCRALHDTTLPPIDDTTQFGFLAFVLCFWSE